MNIMIVAAALAVAVACSGPAPQPTTPAGAAHARRLPCDRARARDSAAVHGTVTAIQNGAPLHSAMVVATSPGLPDQVVATADEHGCYFLGPLPAGRIEINISYEASETRRTVELGAHELRSLDIELDAPAGEWL